MFTPRSSSARRAARRLAIVGVATSGLSLVACGSSSVDGGNPTPQTQILSDAIWDNQVGSTKELVEASELIVLARPSSGAAKASGSFGNSTIEMKEFEVVRVVAGTAVKPGEMIRVGRLCLPAIAHCLMRRIRCGNSNRRSMPTSIYSALSIRARTMAPVLGRPSADQVLCTRYAMGVWSYRQMVSRIRT